jgi:hypothetical protein
MRRISLTRPPRGNDIKLTSHLSIDNRASEPFTSHETRARFREYLIGQQRGQSMPQRTGKSSQKAGFRSQEKQETEVRNQRTSRGATGAGIDRFSFLLPALSAFLRSSGSLWLIDGSATAAAGCLRTPHARGLACGASSARRVGRRRARLCGLNALLPPDHNGAGDGDG